MKSSNILKALFANINVQAFYRTLREKESGQGEDAYTLLNQTTPFTAEQIPFKTEGGKKYFTAGFSKHPGFPHGPAAGAAQFVYSTWQDVIKEWDLPDFSPTSQDLGAVARFIYRGAIDDILQGRFEEAVKKCRLEWTSLPGAGESNVKWTMDKAKEVYVAYGGLFSPNVSSSELPAHFPENQETEAQTPATPPLQQTGQKMPIVALLAAWGPILQMLVPQITKILNPSGDNKSLQLAQVAVDTMVATTQSSNLQEAVEKMQASPVVLDDVKTAVLTEPQIMSVLAVTEIGGGIQAAREFSILVQNAEKPFWHNPTFIVTCIFVPLIYWIVGAVLMGQSDSKYWGVGFTDETRSGIINIVIGMVLGGMVGVWFGTSISSKQKDDTINKQASELQSKG